MNLNNLALKDDKKNNTENKDEEKFISIKKQLKNK